MKARYFLNPFFILLIISCESTDKTFLKPVELEISLALDTTSLSGKTLNHNFGSFGQEESIYILAQTNNAKVCEIIDKEEVRILQYSPVDDFLGIDSVLILTTRFSMNNKDTVEISTISVRIRVVKNDFHQKLIGKWNWIESCGGWTGDCWYPDVHSYEIIEFDNNMVYTSLKNGEEEQSFKYQFTDSYLSGSETIYKIALDNGHETSYYIDGDLLIVQGGDFWMEFERVD